MSTTLGISPPIGQVTRKGKTLIVPRGATLPSCCVKCGIPTEGEPIMHTFRWHNPWVALLAFLGVLIYVIVAMVITKKMDLAVPLCGAHRERRKTFLIIGLVLLAASVPAGIGIGRLAGGPDDTGWSLLAIFILLVTALVLLLPMRNLLRPTYIDEIGARFENAGRDFLDMIPSMHPQSVGQ